MVQAQARSTVTLGFTGDICLGGAVRDQINRHGADYPFALVRQRLSAFDAVIGNLECCLVDWKPTAGEQLMAVPRSFAQGLANAGFRVLTLANNHIMDYGAAGLRTTTSQLTRLGIASTGAGACIDDAARPAIVAVDGARIGILAAVDFAACHATAQHPGALPMKGRLLSRLIAALRGHADIVVVCLHADLEFTPYPSPSRVKLSRWLIDQGASIVVGHHPHVRQGIEDYHDGLIAYSLGNFVFQIQGQPYLESVPGTCDGTLLSVSIDFSASRPTMRWTSETVTIGPEHRPAVTSCGESDVQGELAVLSHGLRDARLLRQHWYSRCRREALITVADAYYALARRRWAAVGRMLLHLLRRREQWRWVLGLLSRGYLS
jgi:hypothetical protein